MLAHDGKESLVISLLALCERIGLPPWALLLGQIVKLRKLGLGGGEVIVVDVLRGANDEVASCLDNYRQQVGAHPIECHARGNVNAQEERERYGQAVGRVLLGAGLLALERVDVVGGHTHDDG